MAISIKDIQRALQYADMAVDGLGYIEGVVGSKTVRTADEIVHIVRAVVAALAGLQNGSITAEDVRSELLKMRAGIRSNDDRADGDLDAKFR